MRNALSELPVLLCCVRGGLVAGLVCAFLRLPRALYYMRPRGRRAGLPLRLLFGLLDTAAAFSAAAVFALTLLYANGGELRLYAVSGFIIAAAGAAAAFHGLVG
ncbi:MAG: hypothetical protein J5772_03390 [Clostridia bacterium]|nr:hypothetical protein [Clostridia bacterium]